MEFRELMRQFTKKELLGMAEELGLGVDAHMNSKSLIKAIMHDLEENGIPAEEDCSAVLEEFLVAAGFIDESGDIVEDDEDNDDDYDEEDVEEEETEYVELRPQCFSYHSSRDPACRKCKIADECEKERLRILSKCYGKSFDQHSEECKSCMENMTCRELVNKEN